MTWIRTRRQRLVLRTALLSVLLGVALVGAVLLRPEPEPYVPGEKIEGLTDDLSRDLPPDYPRVEFVEVSAQAGIDFQHFHGTRSVQLPEDMGSGAAWGDYDGDGWLDLVVTSYGENALYRNDGDGGFADVSQEIADSSGFWAGASWGDYDLDGDLDLYICGYVQYRYDPVHQRNQTRQYDILIPASLNPSTYEPERNLLFRNDGNGGFREVAGEAGVDNRDGRSLAASWSDLDLDGWPDLYVANDLSDNALYRNEGDGGFADISHSAWVADYRGAMGLAAGDWDDDGDPDLFVTHWIAQENAFYTNMLADYREAGLPPEKTALRFMDVADQKGLGQIALDYVGWGTAFVDYDGDGRQDLLVVNGSTFQQQDDPRFLIPMRPLLFWNRSDDDGFFEVGPVSGEVFDREVVGRGLAVGDYDNDGDADAFVVVNGGRGLLLRNEGGNRRAWLKVRLRGWESNSFGIGAKLRAVIGDRVLHREVGAGASYYSQHAVGEVLFGLGEATRVDTLEIAWPGGEVQRLSGLPVDRVVVVEEGGEVRVAAGAKR